MSEPAAEALRKLRNEVLGVLGIAREPIRAIIGNTNMSVLQLRLDEAHSVLTAGEPSSAPQPECGEVLRTSGRDFICNLPIFHTGGHQCTELGSEVRWAGAAQEVSPPSPERVSIEVFQHDWVPGFAAFHDDGQINETAKAHVIINIGSLLAAVQEGDLAAKDLPYMIAESLMHEVIHVLEAWAKVEFSEDRVEELLTKYREKYSRETKWEYTGAEPEGGVTR